MTGCDGVASGSPHSLSLTGFDPVTPRLTGLDFCFQTYPHHGTPSGVPGCRGVTGDGVRPTLYRRGYAALMSNPIEFRVGGRVVKSGSPLVGTITSRQPFDHDASDGPFKINYEIEWDDGTVTSEDSHSLDYARE